jgi:hypothetical protein
MIKHYSLYYIFFLFPFLLISGPFLPDLFISIVSLFFLIFIIFFSKKEKFQIKNNYIFYFLLLFYLYLNLNSLNSDFKSISFSSTVPYIRMIIFSVALCYCLKKDIGLKKIIFYSFLFAYLILFFDAFLQLITGSNIIGYKAHEERISSFFGKKLIM